MSRRAAEEEIRRGAVLVNGIPAEIGQKVDPETDRVEYHGRVVGNGFVRKTYIMLNKPRGYVTTASDERGRPTVIDLVDGVGERVYPVGRLDMDSDGLLLLTNDGELANKLTHPRHSVPKIYNVEVDGKVGLEDCEKAVRRDGDRRLQNTAGRDVGHKDAGRPETPFDCAQNGAL